MPYKSEGEWRTIIITFFQEQGVNIVGAMREFDAFRQQTGDFHPTAIFWLIKSDIEVFWNSAKASTRYIGELALRLARTPGNTVPAERAFSDLNILHSKTRNRMKPETVQMLQTIHINSRALLRERKEKQAEDEVETILLDLEDQLANVGEDGLENPALVHNEEVCDNMEEFLA